MAVKTPPKGGKAARPAHHSRAQDSDPDTPHAADAAVSASKREKREKHERANTMLFIENIPFTMSNGELQELFSEVAPVKLAFVRTKPGAPNLNTGVGYVKYALPEDAEAAIQRFNGASHNGRHFRVSFSAPRPPKEERLQKRGATSEDATSAAVPPAAKTVKKAAPPKLPGKTQLDPEKLAALAKMTRKERYEALLDATDSDPEVRTIIIGDLPQGVTEQDLYQKCRKSGHIENIIYPLPHLTRPGAYVTYSTLRQAMDAVRKLHLHHLHGATISVALKRQEKSVVSGRAKAKSKEARLILRNLSFYTDEKELEHKFGRFGKIVEAKIVRDARNNSKGFGFLQFNAVEAAGKAITEMNGKEINGRTIAVDWALAKPVYEQVAGSEEANVDAAAEEAEEKDDEDEEEEEEGDEEEEEDEDDEEDEDAEEDGERPAAKATAKRRSSAESDDEEEDEEDDEDDAEEDDDNEEDDEDEEPDKDEENEEDEEDGDENSNLTQKKEASRPSRPSDTQEGRTIFIQNLSLDVTEEQLAELFRQFGDLEYGVLVRDKVTNEHRGTGFVKFKTKEAADDCLTRANSQVLDPLELDGRPLKIALAIDKATIEEKQKREKEEKQLKKDRRRHYLLREGQILSGTPAYEDLSENDRTRRDALIRESKQKMANPNFSVSLNRLSIHNLPRTLNSAGLKKLFIEKVGRHAGIKQAIVVTSKDRFDAEGKPVSLCYGFVEYLKHEDALQALRIINNNPDIFGREKRPIVMFAWDDNRVLRIRMLREERKNLRQKQLERNAARAEQQDQWENNVTGKKRPNASKPDAKRAKTTDAKDNGGKKGGKHEGKDAKDDKVAGSAKRGAAAADTAAKSEDGSSRKRPSGAERRRANKEKIRALKEARKAGKATTDGNPNSTAALPAKRKPQENGAKRSAQNMPAKSRAPASTPAPKPAEQPREQPAKKPKTSKPNAQESRRSRKHNAEAQREQAFEDMVAKYRQKLQSTEQAGKTKRWFEA